MQLVARTFGQPALDESGFMRRVVVEDKVDFEIRRYGRVDLVKKFNELDRPMTALQTAENLAAGCIERREKRNRTVAPIVMGAALNLARPHRQEGSRAVQGLNFGLLVHA